MRNEQSEMFSRMAFTLHHEKFPQATVHLVVAYARASIQCDEAGVTLTRRSKLQTAASTSMVVRRADQFQQSLREGPGVDVRDDSAHVLINDTLSDDRWPRWSERVALLGFRSVLSIRLHTEERTYGALNLYNVSPDSFTNSDVAVGLTFGRHASTALASSEEIFNLKIAADSRNLLGQAQGILMERFKIDSDRAFDVLRRYSQTINVKLAVIAQQVVDQQALPTADEQPRRVEAGDSEGLEPSPMTLESRDDGPWRILSLAGEMDLFTAPAFIDAAFAALEDGHRKVIVEMHQTSFIDSSGLSAFILVQKALVTHGGTLDLVGLVDRVRRMFSMAGLDQVLRMHSTLDEAKRINEPTT